MSMKSGYEPMSNTDKPASFDAILEAAVDEFSEKGLAGLRMEHVAKRAGFNKGLVYRFFSDKSSLFNAALERQFSKRRELLGDVPEDLGDMLYWWSEQTRSDPRFMRMILRESLDYSGDEPVMAGPRSEYYLGQIGLLSALQGRGEIDDQFDADYLFLALLAITIAPAAIPQVCRLVTGEEVDSEAFRGKWSRMLHRLAECLKSGG